MPKDMHQKAAEHHDQAAKAHRTASEQHGSANCASLVARALVRRVRGCLQRTRRAHTRVLREVGLVEATTEHDGAPPTSNTGIR